MNIPRALFGLAAVALLAGCGKEEIRTYRAPKEPESNSPHSHHAHQHADDEDSVGPVTSTFKVPANWQRQPPVAMRAESYVVKAEGGLLADVSLIILGGGAGNVLDNVNRWLAQLGQQPVSEEQLAKISQRVATDAFEATIVDLQGMPEGGDATKDGRILAGIAKVNEGIWFFKMRGNAALVESEKEHFMDWVRSTRPSSGAHPASGADDKPDAAPAPASKESAEAHSPIRWDAPKDWKVLPPSELRYASFQVDAANGEKGDVSVVALRGQSGGELANVNRWRQQIGLDPVVESDLKSLVTRFGDDSCCMSAVDLAGSDRRMLAGWLKKGDQTWFFKFTGPSALVGSEKEKFLGFLQSVKFDEKCDNCG